jgi:hypothetical protein
MGDGSVPIGTPSSLYCTIGKIFALPKPIDVVRPLLHHLAPLIERKHPGIPVIAGDDVTA